VTAPPVRRRLLPCAISSKSKPDLEGRKPFLLHRESSLQTICTPGAVDGLQELSP